MELLAPAGNWEKLEVAVRYGADAVYLAGKDFSLRNLSGNFTIEEMDRAVAFARERGVKVYVACNIYPRSREAPAIERFLHQLKAIGPDAVIVADPGIFAAVRRILPDTAVHISTQANTTSLAAARFWKDAGAVRVNGARELTLDEMANMARGSGLEIEAFVHGAMCIAYSGRCLLSGFMAGRESNRGECAHPCRWRYTVVEETRPGRYMPILENSRGTQIFSANDLCMIGHLPDLLRAGIASLKIEGRMKGIHYLATVVRVYRQALDACLADAGAPIDPAWIQELSRVNTRGYCRGFYFGDPAQTLDNFAPAASCTDHLFVGKVLAPAGSDPVRVEVRNKVHAGEAVEILNPKGPVLPGRIEAIIDADGRDIAFAQPGSRVVMTLGASAAPHALIRRREAT